MAKKARYKHRDIRGRGHSHRQKHRKIRRKSRKLVNSGQVPERPCLVCGSREDLTVHHVEPVQRDRFVFLCRPCHVRAHQPLYRHMLVPLAYGQFSIRPEAGIPRKEVCRD